MFFLLQKIIPPCQQEGRDCYSRLLGIENSCRVDCEGLYADVYFVKSTIAEKNEDMSLSQSDVEFVKLMIGKTNEDMIVLEPLMAAYKAFKEKQFKSMTILSNNYSTVPLPYHPLQVVQIYFSTATYDEIVNDVSVSLGDQISAIGGTMGLFAGFSILSAIEVLYFILKFVFSLMSKTRMKLIC